MVKEGDTVDTPFGEAHVVMVYSIEQAVADGVLFDVRTILKPEFRDRSVFSHITTNLLHYGGYYEKDEEGRETDRVNLNNLFDLMNQGLDYIRQASDDFTNLDWIYITEFEMPSGAMETIYMQQNEVGRYTLMLPMDY